MARPDLMPNAIAEREALAALLQTLTPDQWKAPSLCAEWRVRDVAIHVVSFDELSKSQTARTFVRGGMRPGRVNAVAMRPYRDLSTDDIVELVARCHTPRGLTAAMRGGIALTDGIIHHQDIRRAIGVSRTIPTDSLRAALDFSLGAPTLPSKRNAKGLKLRAEDIDWFTGDGPEVAGPAEAILLAVAGRPHALNDLSGKGLHTLRERVTL